MKKIILALVLALCFSTTVLANEHSRYEQEIIALQTLYDVMDLIVEYYSGDEVVIKDLYENAAYGMTFGLDDYSVFFTEEEFKSFMFSSSGNMVGVGVHMETWMDGRVAITNVMKNSPAERAGLAEGDIIVSVNGVTIAKFGSSQISMLIASEDSAIAILEVERDGVSQIFEIEKAEIEMETVEVESISGESGIALVTISMIGERTADELQTAIENLKSGQVNSIIIDFRDNPGGSEKVTRDICNMLVPSGPIFHTRDSKGQTETYHSDLAEVPFKNIAILVNPDTASAAELITAAMQDSGVAVVIGQTTFGKGVIQRLYELETGAALKLTTREYLSRNENQINNIGVKPDIVINIPKPLYNTINLHNDSTGEEVENLKKILTYIGYDVGTINNVYDSLTESAISDLQSKAGLKVTGHIDLETQFIVNIALNEYIEKNDEALAKAIEFIKNR